MNMKLTDVLNAATRNNGGTFIYNYDSSFSEANSNAGYWVSKPNGIVVPRLRKVVVDDFIKHRDYDITTNYIGFWYDPDTVLWYIDVVRHTYDRAAAVTMSIKYEQKAYFDIANNEAIPTKI